MQYYNEISRGYAELHQAEQLKKLAIISKALTINKSTLLLDVGCGTGISSNFNCRVFGIDPSIELLKQATIPRVLGVAEFLPFKDKSFDIIISVTALHNFSDHQKGLSEIARVGKGRLALTVLKKSRYAQKLADLLKKDFLVEQVVEEEKDSVYFLKIFK